MSYQDENHPSAGKYTWPARLEIETISLLFIINLEIATVGPHLILLNWGYTPYICWSKPCAEFTSPSIVPSSFFFAITRRKYIFSNYISFRYIYCGRTRPRFEYSISSARIVASPCLNHETSITETRSLLVTLLGNLWPVVVVTPSYGTQLALLNIELGEKDSHRARSRWLYTRQLISFAISTEWFSSQIS